MGQIKFRAYHREAKEMLFEDNIGDVLQWAKQKQPIEIMEFTGLLDKNGKEIYEGDILRVRIPMRDSQTHTGDNIPNGSYTEPMEPIVKEDISPVVFHNGAFCYEDSIGFCIDDSNHLPVSFMLDMCARFNDEEELKQAFSGNWWKLTEQWKEDLEYLLEEYGLPSLEELYKYLGVEIIGNIYTNPELLEEKKEGSVNE